MFFFGIINFFFVIFHKTKFQITLHGRFHSQQQFPMNSEELFLSKFWDLVKSQLIFFREWVFDCMRAYRKYFTKKNSKKIYEVA